MKAHLILVLALVSILSACNNPSSAERQSENMKILSSVKEKDTIVCKQQVNGVVYAITVQQISHKPDRFTGLKTSYHSASWESRIVVEHIAKWCSSIAVVINQDEAANVVGRILLGLPLKTSAAH